MFFLINDEIEFIMGWSAKCACSAIKWWFVEISNIDVGSSSVHEVLGYGNTSWSRIKKRKIKAYEEYMKFILIRDPYKRLISGYVNKYVIEKAYKIKGWTNFEEFVEIMESDQNFRKINRHHFTPQTSEDFNKAIINNWKWDHILNVDTITSDIDKVNKMLNVNINLVHHNKTPYKNNNIYSIRPYHMSNELVLKYMPGYEYFYNKTIIDKVNNIYKNDFTYFEQFGFYFKTPI